jgi:inward rectifier potassium channel
MELPVHAIPPRAPAAPVPEDDRDLGFGAVVARESRRRLLNADGSFNVRREGLGPVGRLAPYHSLLVMGWPEFLGYVALLYVALNIAFGVGYWLLGADVLRDTVGTLPGTGASVTFLRAVFFSVHTFATIGYGTIVPIGVAANALVAVESFVGLLTVALVTGLVFARFSRPTARVRFSRSVVIAPYHAGTALMFRLVNERRTEMLQLEARVLYSHVVDDGGRRTRRFDELPLERHRVVFFPLSWTIVHPIDAASPLAGATHERLVDDEAEILVLLSGVDETNGQLLHARTSYRAEDIVEGARFASLFNPASSDGVLSIDVTRLDALEPVAATAEPRMGGTARHGR